MADCYENRAGRMTLVRSHLPDFAAGLDHIPGRGRQVSDGKGGYWIEDLDEPVPGDAYVLRPGRGAVDHRIRAGDDVVSLSAQAPGARVRIALTGKDARVLTEPVPKERDGQSGNSAVLRLIMIVAIGLSLFQLYAAGIRPLGLFYQRPIHLGFVLVLCFLIYPVFGKDRPRGALGWAIDGPLIACGVLVGFWLPYNIDMIANSIFPRPIDVTVGVITTLVVLEGARRAVGLGMTIIGAVFLAYAFAGQRGELPWLADWLPGILNHRGYSLDRVASQMTLGAEGIFGIPLGVAATFVFIFVLFGAFLEATGAGKFFIDLAYAGTGRQRGGPAKAAVLASAGMGSISGSAIANVVTTGAFTIPLMKRLGYRPAQAGGIEAAASTGGQIMPPLMGAGAFLMSEFTQVPYVDIVLVSVFPAFLYFGAVYLLVHIAAVKQGMTGLPSEELPKSARGAGRRLALPDPALCADLVPGGGLFADAGRVLRHRRPWSRLPARGRCGALHFRGRPSRGSSISARRGVRMMLSALELGARNAVAVSMACAVAGIIVGVVGLTGLGLKFSAMMIAFSGGNIVLALLLVILASLILGHGAAGDGGLYRADHPGRPALTEEFGIPILIAHLVVFWYSQDSNVTPPVALAGFAGAAIAGARPMETSVQAWKYAKGLYLIPLFMVFNESIILGGPLPLVIWNGLIAMLAIVAFAALLEGFLFAPIVLWQRALLAPGVIAVFWPDLRVEALGAALLVTILVLNWRARAQAAPMVN